MDLLGGPSSPNGADSNAHMQTWRSQGPPTRLKRTGLPAQNQASCTLKAYFTTHLVSSAL